MITLHMDPIVMDDEKTNSARTMVIEMVNDIDSSLSIHDFRMVSGPHHTNLIFDVVLPFSCKLDGSKVIELINQKLAAHEKNYYAVVTIDRNYN